jgi:cysteinyl-tRNA synthetase
MRKFDELFAVLGDDDVFKMKTIAEWAKAEGRENEITDELWKVIRSGELTDAQVEQKVAEMEAARKARNFAVSDGIRAELVAAGILVENTKDGVRWRRK